MQNEEKSSLKRFNYKVITVIITFLMLVFSYILLFIYAQKLTYQSNWIIHTHLVMDRLEKLSSADKSVDNHYTAYLQTGDKKFKIDIDTTYAAIDKLTKEILYLVEDNKVQKEILKNNIVKEYQNKKLDIKNGINTIESSGFEENTKNKLIDASISRNEVGGIGKYMATMINTETELLLSRTSALDKFSETIKIINFTSLFIALGFSFLAFMLYRKEYIKRKSAAEISENYRLELEKQVKELAKANNQIDELKEVEKFASTGRVARVIAHEIRNPLTNINLAAEQLKSFASQDEEHLMLFSMLSRNSNRINELISNLLNATRFIELAPKMFSINAVINQALEKAKDRIELRNVKVTRNFDDHICEINVDGDKMEMAFLNIIVNAIEAMPENGGVLEVRTLQDDNDHCHIIFKDNGKGMDDDVKGKIFEPFFTAKENGNGLGMTNTKNIILNHKGKIMVESKLGEGTTFEIII